MITMKRNYNEIEWINFILFINAFYKVQSTKLQSITIESDEKWIYYLYHDYKMIMKWFRMRFEWKKLHKYSSETNAKERKERKEE